MSRFTVSRLGLVLFVSAVFSFGWTVAANATLINPDGDFNAQTVGTSLTTPWTKYLTVNVTAAAQSPFTNVFATNGKGVSLAGANPYPYFYESFTAIPANATGLMSFNFDFENTSSGTAQWGMYLSSGATSATTTAAVFVDSGNLYAQSSAGKSASLMSLSLNTWYNVQLTLNMSANTYSGTVTPYGGSATAIAGGTFATENPIDTIFSQWAVAGNGGVAHNIDNIALSSVPEPSTLTLLGCGLLALVAYAWRKRR